MGHEEILKFFLRIIEILDEKYFIHISLQNHVEIINGPQHAQAYFLRSLYCIMKFKYLFSHLWLVT